MHHLQYILISQDWIKIQCTVEQFRLFASVDQRPIQGDCNPFLPGLASHVCGSLEIVPGSLSSLCHQQCCVSPSTTPSWTIPATDTQMLPCKLSLMLLSQMLG